MRISLASHTVIASTIGALACPPAAAREPHASVVALTIGGAQIEVEIHKGHLDVSRDELITWVSTAANAVTAYFGRFPVTRYRLVIQAAPGVAGVVSGTTWAADGAHSRLVVGEHATAEELAHDWVLTHEMVHTSFPDQPEAHHWIEEGIATYVEPLARSWIGQYPAAKVWVDLVAGLPKGLPTTGDRGLDHTPTWGRTY
jgi:hypothetical protein